MWGLIPEREDEGGLKLKVSDIMNRNLITVSPKDSVYKVAKLMKEHNIGSVIVMDGSKLEGIVTERDLISRYLAVNEGRKPEEVRVEEVMTKDPVKVRENVDLDEAVSIMIEKNVRRVIVVNSNDRVVGIISSRDVLRIAPHIWFVLSQRLRMAESSRSRTRLI